MKRKVYAIIAMILFLPSYAFSEDLGFARVTLVDGDVQMYSEDAGEWSSVTVNMPLREGDWLWVPEQGRAEVQLRGGTYIRLDENSSFGVIGLERGSARFSLDAGRLYASGLREGSISVRIDTPILSVSSREGCTFMVDVPDGGGAEVAVVEGHAYVEHNGGRTRVDAGNALRADENRYAELSPLGRPDSWEEWNRQRDMRLSVTAESARYLPGELVEYAYDFDENGRWVYEARYGYVWVPAVAVTVGWAPYRHGRWIWAGGNYLWVSFESWGWVPYHYGRWAHVTGTGWCWVPPSRGAVYWAPGLVAWVTTPAYVAWVPLAPGELYYGYGSYGPRSVNLLTINIRNISVKKVYRNISVINAVTTVHRDTFYHGKQRHFRIKHNPFLGQRVVMGPPDTRPTGRAAFSGRGNIQKAKRPPKRLQEYRLRRTEQKRKPTRAMESRVLKPDIPVRKMPSGHVEKPAGKTRGKETVRSIHPVKKTVGKRQASRPEDPRVRKQEAKSEYAQRGGAPARKTPSGHLEKPVGKTVDKPVHTVSPGRKAAGKRQASRPEAPGVREQEAKTAHTPRGGAAARAPKAAEKTEDGKRISVNRSLQRPQVKNTKEIREKAMERGKYLKARSGNRFGRL